MRRLRSLVVIAALPLMAAVALADPLGTALSSIREHQLHAHLWLLSHDRMRGRAPGTPGGETAALYVASQFARAGVEPLGGSYLQQVPLVALTPMPSRTVATFAREGETLALEYGAQFFAWSGQGDSIARVDAELLFLGYGIEAPEYDWDDFAGRDVRGKVLMVLVNDPPAPPEEPQLFQGRGMTYYGRWSYKIEEAHRRGAAGVLIVHESVAAGYPWTVVRNSWSGERLALERSTDGAVDVAGWITRVAADSVLKLGGLSLDELSTQAARRDFAPVATGIRVRMSVPAQRRRFDSSNVWGVVRGSDPALRNEVVVFTAHYDHLGIGRPIDGDSIYNGAYDNASGVAALIEIAEGFALMQPRPARSILFLATTAEEAGLLGAEQYMRHPAFPLERTAAAINLDGVNLWGATDDVIVIGAEQSTLGEVAQARAQAMDLTMTGDRSPERGFFFRSDQFPFAREGIPAIKIEHGTRFRDRSAGWGERVLRDYEDERYHRPADELPADADLAGAVQQARLALAVGFDVAQADSMPAWYPASGFRRSR